MNKIAKSTCLILVTGVLMAFPLVSLSEESCERPPLWISESFANEILLEMVESRSEVSLGIESDEILIQLYLWSVLLGHDSIFLVQPSFKADAVLGSGPYVDLLLWLIAHDPALMETISLSVESAESLMDGTEKREDQLDSQVLISIYRSKWSLYGHPPIGLHEMQSLEFGLPGEIAYYYGLALEEEGSVESAYLSYLQALKNGYEQALMGLLRLELSKEKVCESRVLGLRTILLR